MGGHGHGGGGHGHGGHGHGHGGGGIGFGPGWGWGYPGGWYDDGGGDVLIVNPQPTQAPDAAAQRMLAYIMSLPKAQRVAAYTKIFGHAPAPGALGDFTLAGISTTTLAVLGGVGYLLYHFTRKK